MFPYGKLSGKHKPRTGNKIADSSRDGVDFFLTYLVRGISRRPTIRISVNQHRKDLRLFHATYLKHRLLAHRDGIINHLK